MEEEVEERFEELEDRVERLEGVVFSKEEEFDTLDDRIQGLAERMEVEAGDLHRIVEFGADKPYILEEVTGQSLKEKQRAFVTMFLTILRYCYGSDEMQSSALQEIAKDRGIWSTDFGSNVKSFRPYLRLVGKPRSPNAKYKVTHPAGTKKGMELLSGLLEG